MEATEPSNVSLRENSTSEEESLPDLYEASIAELQEWLQKKQFASVDLVKAYLARIEEVNRQGPALRAVIETNPNAVAQARTLDLERRQTGARGLLHGIPIIVKDNISTQHSEGMNTTAGSFALLSSVVSRDATVIAKLRAAGAIILGKANLSEWANFRGKVPSGFSGRGGQTTSPYVPLGDPSGSSSGSGVAAAIGLAAGTLGTETDGSIVFPSSKNNIVGIKPTVGLTSRAGVIPLSSHQDSIGPMCRTVADVAVILATIAGKDPLDEATLSQPEVVPDYTKALNKDALRGTRLGIPRELLSDHPHILSTFNAAVETIKGLGATIVDPTDFPDYDKSRVEENELIVLRTDLKIDLKKYLSGLIEVPTGVKDLGDLIAFNSEHADLELVQPYWNDQSIFIAAESTTADEAYHDAVAASREQGQAGGIDAVLKKYNLDALVLTMNGASQPAAIAGYPIITVPLGFQREDVELSEAKPTRATGPNMPFGISFIGTAYSEFKLISYAFAFEQATQTRLKQKAFAEAIPKTQLKDVIGSETGCAKM